MDCLITAISGFDYFLHAIASALNILRTGIICAFHKLPLPAGEGWGGDSKYSQTDDLSVPGSGKPVLAEWIIW